MFKSIKRAVFIGKFSGDFASRFNRFYDLHGDISNIHLKLQQAGWPANELVDLFIASKTSESEFTDFIVIMYEACFDNDRGSIEYLCSWSKQDNVIEADNAGLSSWLEGLKS